VNADDPRHGTNAGYIAHFTDSVPSCQPCREAHATYRRNLWRKKYLRRVDDLYISSIPTVRRIRALQAIGWRLGDIDTHMGHLPRTNYAHNLCRQNFIHRNSAEKVAVTYEALAMQPGPSARAVAIAARNGWPPPLAWDDIDDPDETPTGWQYVPATRAEMFAELVEANASVSEACRRLVMNPGALEKWCDRSGLRPEFNAMNARERAVFEVRNQWNGKAS
jgi:hypothetical protein